MESNEIGKLIKFILIIICVLVVFYFVTIFVTNKKNAASTEDTEEAVIQYDEILIGSIYNQSEDEYYVLVKEEGDFYSDLLDTALSTYSDKDGALRVYTANLNSVLNKKFFAENSSFDSTYPIMSETTLLKIQGDKVVSHYEGSENVLEQLKLLSE